jgi:hypothetical protein
VSRKGTGRGQDRDGQVDRRPVEAEEEPGRDDDVDHGSTDAEVLETTDELDA